MKVAHLLVVASVTLLVAGCASSPAVSAESVQQFQDDLSSARSDVQQFIASPPSTASGDIDCTSLNDLHVSLNHKDVIAALPTIGQSYASSAVAELKNGYLACLAGGNAGTPLNDFVLFSGSALNAFNSR